VTRKVCTGEEHHAEKGSQRNSCTTSEGKSVWMVGTDLITFKAVSEDTDGAFALFDIVILSQGGHHRTYTIGRTSRSTFCEGK
jgi:hypothetical protein